MSERTPLAVCFGEILFDRFEDGDYPGGAPLNFAWYLRQFGVSVAIVSAVGQDDLGDAAMGLLDRAGIERKWVGRRPEPTGTAAVSLRDGQPTYVLPQDAAWDHIGPPATPPPSGSLVYFGTLAQRTADNRACLAGLLASRFHHRVFDVNLRLDFYSDEIIADGLAAAIVTMGREGAELHTRGRTFQAASAPALAGDTVGAGDAFCAVIAAAAVHGVDLARALPVACDAGAFVAARRGAQIELPAELRAAFGRAAGR